MHGYCVIQTRITDDASIVSSRTVYAWIHSCIIYEFITYEFIDVHVMVSREMNQACWQACISSGMDSVIATKGSGTPIARDYWLPFSMSSWARSCSSFCLASCSCDVPREESQDAVVIFVVFVQIVVTWAAWMPSCFSCACMLSWAHSMRVKI